MRLSWLSCVLFVAAGGSLSAGCNEDDHLGVDDLAVGSPDLAIEPVKLDLAPGPATVWTDCGAMQASARFDPGPYGDRPVCPTSDWCWQFPTPQGMGLRGVSWVGPKSAWAVGGYGTIYYSQTSKEIYGVSTVLHFDGEVWSAVPPTFERDLVDVWAASDSDVWAIGHWNLIAHYDGKSWTKEESSEGYPIYRAITGSGPGDVWVVGDSRYARHFDGGGWTNVSIAPFPSAMSIFAAGPGEVYLVGSDVDTGGGMGSRFDMARPPGPKIARWNGQAFEVMEGSPTTSPARMGGTGPKDLWVTGDSTWHYDGVAWTKVAEGEGGPVWAPAPGEAWLMGSGDKGRIVHCTDGGRSCVDVGKGGLDAVSGRGADAWAVGEIGEMMHFDGAAWTSTTRRLTPHGLKRTRGSGSKDVWAVGDGGAIVHFDGTGWALMPTCTNGEWNDLWVGGPDNVWIVGPGKILHGDGARWHLADSPAPAKDLWSIWGSGPKDLWAIGGAESTSPPPRYSGMLLHSDGRDFRVVYTYGQGLGPVGGSGPNDVYFTSTDRNVFHFDGTLLTAAREPDELLWARAIWSGGANDTWMAGTNGVMHGDGKGWTFTNVPFQDSRDLWGSSPSDLWTGGFSELRHFDGRAWLRARLPSADLYSGYAASARDAWILADSGALRRK